MTNIFYKASAELSNEFLKYPESGMGYQYLHFYHENDLIPQYYLVLNGQVFSTLDNASYMLSKVKEKNYDINMLYFSAYKTVLLSEVKDIKQSNPKEGSAANNPKQEADGEMKFVRLSPYRNDLRVDEDKKCLKPGSYTTTYRDYLKCKEICCNPTERYALPSKESVKWEFHVTPKKGDEFRLGTVQPDYDQPGGGEEALFDDGTSENTLTLVREFKRYG